MTVKLAKLFGGVGVGVVGVGMGVGVGVGVGLGAGSGSSVHGESIMDGSHQPLAHVQTPAAQNQHQHQQAQQPPPLPPTNTNMKNLKYCEHLQASYDCHDLMRDEEDDQDNYEYSMSLSSVCMQRNQPFNNSQRPLLGERRPQLTLTAVGQKTVAKSFQQHALPGPALPLAPQRGHATAAYISPYVHQQKRDSAKGLHGFNDFDALSQQYNQHLQSPHIGYPYGSPPSPTAHSRDFCFDRQSGQATSSSSSNCSSSVTTSTASPTSYYQDTATAPVYPSRFEDDFCVRRPADSPLSLSVSQAPPLPPTAAAASTTGPFIFGISHEQQPAHYGCTPVTPTASRNALQHLTIPFRRDHKPLHSCAASSSKGSKFLLRKRKSKKTAAPATPNDGSKTAANGGTNADVNVNESPVHLTLCDTAGQDTLDPLRELCYPDSDVFLLCFSVVKPETFRAIKSKWAPKFAKAKAALILVGTQADLRGNQSVLNKLQTNGEKAISYADAWDLATTIGAKYIETSSATQEKVKDVFDTAIWEGLVPTTLPPTPSFWRKLFCLA
ncbi:uncharacterized protein LOC108163424 isoform X2 [Drosophila miranda]|uniref:uncharacterized protein LOC108163424 isoform X2 n=1 Tax=Drosophila miranda TaxID=7229 RepID=UPI00143F7088|nr:uncharacterized protein LOC108163424 isoform X2 [Drosophila miranda]